MPGSMNQKNLALSPAAADLGLGSSLKVQVDDQVAEMKKRKLGAGALNDMSSPAAQMLLNPTFGGSNG